MGCKAETIRLQRLSRSFIMVGPVTKVKQSQEMKVALEGYRGYFIGIDWLQCSVHGKNQSSVCMTSSCITGNKGQEPQIAKVDP